MNNLHCYLDLPFEIKKPDICNTTPSENFHTDLKDIDNAEMFLFHDRLGLSINHVEVFYTPAGMSLPIHADTTELNNKVKVNITWGPEEGLLRWYKTDKTIVKGGEPNEGQTHRQHKNVRAERKDCELIYEVSTNWPSLVNVGQLHDTYSPPHAGRWTLCFVPQVKGSSDRSLDWYDAIEYYKDYIV